MKMAGIQLISKNIQSPLISFLDKEDILKGYQEKIQKFNEKARKTLDIFTFNDGVIKGSNAFANQLLTKDLASPAEVLQASEINPEYFRGFYVDLGSMLRTNGDSYKNNNHLSKNLFKELKARNIIPTSEEPVMIWNKGLMSIDSKSGDNPYGLIYRLTDDDSMIIQDHGFSHEFNGRQFLEVDERCVPKYLTEDEIQELSQGKKAKLKTFYARKDGLSGFFLNWDGDLISSSGDLAVSYSIGRIHVVKNSKGGKTK